MIPGSSCISGENGVGKAQDLKGEEISNSHPEKRMCGLETCGQTSLSTELRDHLKLVVTGLK